MILARSSNSLWKRPGSRPANRRVSFAEIELDLKKGEANDLFAAALNLAQAAPLRLSQQSKADRGYALLKKNAPKPAKAQQLSLESDWSIAQAFQVIAKSCLRQLIANETLLRENPNPDAVHQARVAIRRLRAAISLFKDIVTDEQTDALKSELKWIADKLGKARDLDVFMAKSLEPSARAGDEAALRLLADYRTQRNEAYAGAIDAIRSPRFSRTVLAVAAWIETGPWLAGEVEDDFDWRRRPIGPFAHAEFDRRWRKARSRLKSIDKVDEETRHRARIDIKKIRYAAEFFMTLLKGRSPEKRVQNTLEVIEGLQATLGDLNDIAVARLISAPAKELSVQRSRGEKNSGAPGRGQTAGQGLPIDRGILDTRPGRLSCVALRREPGAVRQTSSRLTMLTHAFRDKRRNLAADTGG